MLNYIWAGLIAFALLFALVSDVGDLRNDTYRNGRPLAATIRYRSAADANSREAPVEVVIDPAEYARHFGVGEKLAATLPATLSRIERGSQLRFAKDATLPPRLATIRDTNDNKELLASIATLSTIEGDHVAASLVFPPVRFLKMRAITTAAIDTAKLAVEIAIGLVGVLALWLGLMKIGEAAGLIDAMVKLVQPILRPLFPSVPKGHPALGYIAINLAGNILGLGNATTAMGLKAMEELQKLNPSDDTATDPMVMLLAMHTAAFQLVPPATVIAVMGFAAAEVFIPMFVVGLIATIVAILAAKVLGMLPMYRRTNPERNVPAPIGGGTEVAA
jgi:spore maturation protein A